MTGNDASLFAAPAPDQVTHREPGRFVFSPAALQRRLVRLRWMIPIGLLLLVVAYEVGPASWIYIHLGYGYHLLAEILLFGTVGPVLAFSLLDLLGRWLAERETSDLQAQILSQARARIENSRQLNDDALQALFAAGLLMTSLQSGHTEFPKDKIALLEETEGALHQAIERLRTSLLN